MSSRKYWTLSRQIFFEEKKWQKNLNSPKFFRNATSPFSWWVAGLLVGEGEEGPTVLGRHSLWVWESGAGPDYKWRRAAICRGFRWFKTCYVCLTGSLPKEGWRWPVAGQAAATAGTGWGMGMGWCALPRLSWLCWAPHQCQHQAAISRGYRPQVWLLLCATGMSAAEWEGQRKVEQGGVVCLQHLTK